VKKTYRYTWFESRKAGARQSASVVLPLVCQVLRPKSVVDVGCGTGSWLAVFHEMGVREVLGVDAARLDHSMLEISRSQFLEHDLSAPLELDRRFELALCLEVGEHLVPERADHLVAELTALAPAVLFSAAVPGQGGTGHRNEQWPEYWAERFVNRGFRPHDFLRAKLWRDGRVRYFYAQNMVLYVRERDAGRFPLLPAAVSGLPLPLVHPRLLERTQRMFPKPNDVTVTGLGYFVGRMARHPFEWRTRREDRA
jgi:SAM-dependent methyltransferase